MYFYLPGLTNHDANLIEAQPSLWYLNVALYFLQSPLPEPTVQIVQIIMLCLLTGLHHPHLLHTPNPAKCPVTCPAISPPKPL